MTDALITAKHVLLNPGSLDETGIEKLFKTMMTHRIDDADLYFQKFGLNSHCHDSILHLICPHLGVYSDLCPTNEICDLQKASLQFIYTGAPGLPLCAR